MYSVQACCLWALNYTQVEGQLNPTEEISLILRSHDMHISGEHDTVQFCTIKIAM